MSGGVVYGVESLIFVRQDKDLVIGAVVIVVLGCSIEMGLGELGVGD